MDSGNQQSSCPQRSKLAAALDEILGHLVNLTRSQREAFQRRDEAEFGRLDRELENAIGEKERRVGALNQHEREHGC
jgi:hypothetical protein